MQQPGRSRGVVRFQDFELDLSSGELHRNGESTLRLSEQPFRILCMLLERPGQIVSREEIRKKLWPNNTIVEFEHSISAAINRLRQVLGDSASDPHYVDTLARRGYRWMVPVQWVDTPQESPPVPSSSPTDQHLIGKQVSHYRILEFLGGGGMGVVYESDDLKLGRRVAMKFLSPELAIDAAVLQRFEREARAASALDHPSICTVHEVDEYEGKPFIVMQLLRGQTLRERIETREGRRPLPFDELLAVAVQIADGLEAAHQRGIIHRDIKPANIFITEHGQAKILDFGVAKLIEKVDPPESPASKETHDPGTQHSLGLTLAGKAIGTAAYMSPEQVRGEKLDGRTDLFSFGLVLYEMVTGVPAFKGDTGGRNLSSIKPPLLPQLGREVPGRLGDIIEKSLQEDRELRYQSATELAADLRQLQRDGSLPGAVKEPPNGKPRMVLFGSFAVLLAIAITVGFIVLRTPKLRVASITQITRDGMAKSQLVGDGSRLYYMQIDHSMSSSDVDIIAAEVSGAGGDAVPMRWSESHWIFDLSPNGSELLAGRYKPFSLDMELWAVPLLGGSPRRVGDVIANQATFTPNGQEVVYTLGRELFIVGLDGRNRRKIANLNGAGWSPRVSPDGRRVRLTLGEAGGMSGAGSLLELDIDGSGLRSLLTGFNDPPQECCGAWTSDGKFFLFQSRQGDTQNIWALSEARLPLGRRKPFPITNGPLSYSSPTPSRDGRRVFVIGDHERGELIRYDRESRRYVPYLGGISAEWLAFSPDGQWVAYSLRPQGTLWRSRITGAERVQLTSGTMKTAVPAWSPDGTRIAFSGWERGRPPRIYVVSATGGTAEPVTPDDPYDQVDPTWSADGRYLIYARWPSLKVNAPEQVNIYRVDLSSKYVTVIPGSKGLYSPRCSPDGRFLVAHPTDNSRLMLYTFATGKWEVLVHGRVGWETWARDSQTIYYEDSRFAEFVGLRMADRRRQRIPLEAPLPRVLGFWAGLTPDLSPMVLRDVSTHEIYALELER